MINVIDIFVSSGFFADVLIVLGQKSKNKK